MGLGYGVGPEEQADVIVVLACSVRQHAVDRIHGKLHSWLERAAPPKIILTGCVLPTDRLNLQHKVDLVIDAEDISEATLEPVIPRVGQPAMAGKIVANRSVAYLPIMLGCNFFCTYCAVPFTRGTERSCELADILDEARQIIQSGAKEIMLLGQTVNSYGRDRRQPIKDTSGRPHSGETDRQQAEPTFPTFAELLLALNELPGDFMISFLSPYPTEFTDASIEMIARLPKIKKSIHLPLQSGSNAILKRMNRRYSVEQYIEVAERLLREVPGCTLTTDIIVGFPGETEEHFAETVQLVKRIPFSFAYLSQYSPRSGTVSARFMKDDVSRAAKKERWRVLDELINQPTLRARVERIGRLDRPISFVSGG